MKSTTRAGETLSSDALSVIGQILTDPAIPPTRATQMVSAIHRYLDLRRRVLTSEGMVDTSEEAVLTCERMNEVLWRRSAAFHNLSERSFANQLSGLRAVLRLAGRHAPSVRGPENLVPAWRQLHDALPTSERRLGLVGFMGYATLTGILPDQVGDTTLRAYGIWLRTENLQRDPGGKVRRTASGWNWAAAHVPGWPAVRLTAEGGHEVYSPPLDACHPEFTADARLFLARLASYRTAIIYPEGSDQTSGRRSPRSVPRPLKPRTVQTREYQIRSAIAALTGSGVPMDEIRSLRDLVHPMERVDMILGFHADRALSRRANRKAGAGDTGGSIQTTALAGIADLLRQIAKFHCQLPAEELAVIQQFVEAVSPPQQMAMNAAIAERLRTLFEPRNYIRLINYPEELLRQAVAPNLKPKAAARLVMLAIALEVLLFIPLRRQNLVQLHLDSSLRSSRPGGPIERIHVAGDAVKASGRFIDLPVPEHLARLLAVYIKKHRPHLAEPGNRWLFPGLTQSHRDPAEFGTAISTLIERDLGVRFNPHLARHFAAVRFLRDHPGQYSVVSRLLGHRDIETTRTYYASFMDADAAAGAMNAALLRDRRATRQLATAAFRPPPRARHPQPGQRG